MPSPSTAQRRAMAIAEHHPSELYDRNKGMLKMSQSQLHDFASTPEKGLPHYVEGKAKEKRKGFGLKRRRT